MHPAHGLSLKNVTTKKGINQVEPELSPFVARSGVEPETFGL